MAKRWNGEGAGYQFLAFGRDGEFMLNPDRLVLTKSAKGKRLFVSQVPWPAGEARVEVITRNGTGGTVNDPAMVSDGYVIKGGETLEFTAQEFPTEGIQRVSVLLTTEDAPAT